MESLRQQAKGGGVGNPDPSSIYTQYYNSPIVKSVNMLMEGPDIS